jgi:hypothetical protein
MERQMKIIIGSLRSCLDILHALPVADAVSNCRSWPSAHNLHILSCLHVYCVTARMTGDRPSSVGPCLSAGLFPSGRIGTLKASYGCVRAYYIDGKLRSIFREFWKETNVNSYCFENALSQYSHGKSALATLCSCCGVISSGAGSPTS